MSLPFSFARPDSSSALPVLSLVLRPLPLFPLRGIMAHVLARLLTRHPGLSDRLGAYRTATYLIDPVDLPFVFLFSVNPENPVLRPVRRSAAPAVDAGIAGSIGALFALADGRRDGDALFFSRDLAISGQTEAVLALRNALDDLDIHLIEEVADILGPFGFPLRLADRLLEGRQK